MIITVMFSAMHACAQSGSANAPVISSAGGQNFADEIAVISSVLLADLNKAGFKSVAVLDFVDLEGKPNDLGRFVAEELSTDLIMHRGEMNVVDRETLRALLKEQQVEPAALADPEIVKKFGKAVDINGLIAGSVVPMGRSIRVTSRIIETGTARVVAAEAGALTVTRPILEVMGKDAPKEGQPPATEATAASASAPPIKGMVTDVPDAATLVVGTEQVHLQGIEPGPLPVLGNFAKWAKTRSPVECVVQQEPGLYRCTTSNGVDVAETAILNGAGRAANDASPLYKQSEATAKQARRGLWGR